MNKVIEHNIETGEIVEREMTIKEQEATEAIAQQLADQAAKETARQSLLDRLGITADEAKLLLG